MKLPNNPFKYRYHVFRGKLIQPIFWTLFFLGPALDIFRVDMLGQKLVFLRHAYPFGFNSLMWLPIGFYGMVIIIGLVSFIWGRLFCGWTCPHNIMTEWTLGLRAIVGREAKPAWLKRLLRKYPNGVWGFRTLSIVLALALTFVMSLLLSFYVIPPDWALSQYQSGVPNGALVYGNGLIMLIGLFLLYAGHDFCRTVCPYGLAQSVSAYHENSPWRPMEIKLNGNKETDCRTCTACQQVCPVEIDPRDGSLKGLLKVGQFDGCFNCGECIDACKHVHSFKKKPGLLSFKMAGRVSKRLKPDLSKIGG